MPDTKGVGTYVNELYEGNASDSIVDLFNSPPVDLIQIHGREQTVYPTANLTDGPIEFLIPTDFTDFTALDKTRLEGEIEICKISDGSEFANTDKVSICNLLPHSLFKQIECSINEFQVNDLSTPTYPYKAYIETHLTYNEEMKNTTLKDCEFYIKDTPGKEHSTAITGDTKNDGFVNRQALFLGAGKKMHFSIVPHIDFFHCPRYLIPGCDVKLKFIRNDDTFSLIEDTAVAKIKLNNLRLKVRRITLAPEVSSKVESLLNSDTAKYPICASKIKTWLINSGTKSTVISQMVRGKLPRSFILGFINAKSVDSNIAKNPFVFEHFKLNYLNVQVNAEPINNPVLQPNYATENYTREYAWFLDNLGLHQNLTIGITKEDFKHNSCFYPFDLSPDLNNNITLHGIESGTIDAHIGFETALTENIYLMMIASYDEIISIDKNRNVTIS